MGATTASQMVTLLKQDVVPALGCTEPVCMALCAAEASKLLEGSIHFIDAEVNPGIYKNGMSAGIPGCPHVGLKYAAALGACLKNPEKKLSLLEDITPKILSAAEKLCVGNHVQVKIAGEERTLYVRCAVCSDSESAVCVIRDAHTNITRLEKNGTVVYQSDGGAGTSSDSGLAEELGRMTIADIRDAVDTIPEKDLLFLLDGAEMNEKLSAYSEGVKAGVGIADAFRKGLSSSLLSDGLLERIILKTSSAAESRLDGCRLPAMSSSGAGTKGLVVILPVVETARELGVSREERLRAIALAHLVNRFINDQIGRLSPMCTCVAAASTAASVGITYLLGGTNEQLGYAVRNMTGTVTGMICDGGKVGCALKVAAGSASALLCALTAIGSAPLRVSDGICADTPEECIRNMARIGKTGMKDTDREILRIMEEKESTHSVGAGHIGESDARVQEASV